MPVGIVASWRCKCGTFVRVFAQADSDRTPPKQTVSCPNCGDQQIVYGDKIISVTGDKSETQETPHATRSREAGTENRE